MPLKVSCRIIYEELMGVFIRGEVNRECGK